MSLQIGTFNTNSIIGTKKELQNENTIQRRTLSGSLRVQTISQNFGYIFNLQNIKNSDIELLESELFENGNILPCTYGKTGWNINGQDFFVEIIDQNDDLYKHKDINDINRGTDISIKIITI